MALEFTRMRQDLATLEAGTRSAMEDARMLFASFSPQQAVARPREGAWSPAECLDHLTLTAEAFLPILDAEIARAARQSDQSYQPGWLGRWFLRQIDAPPKGSFKAPPRFLPAGTRTGDESLQTFLTVHEKLLARIPGLIPLDLRKIRVQSPFAQWMTYPLGLVCYLIPAHCRRHLWQARYPRGIP